MITTSLIYQTLAVLLIAQQATFTVSVVKGPNFRRGEPSKPPKRIINVADAPVGVPVASLEEVAKLPKSFDGRTAWSECSSLRHVSHQGSCGSCWAVVTTDVAADRLCIASKGIIWMMNFYNKKLFLSLKLFSRSYSGPPVTDAPSSVLRPRRLQ